MNQSELPTSLKPCPFCGDEALLAQNDHYGDTDYVVFCQNRTCWARTKWFETAEEAIEAWNRRIKDGTDSNE